MEQREIHTQFKPNTLLWSSLDIFTARRRVSFLLCVCVGGYPSVQLAGECIPISNRGCCLWVQGVYTPSRHPPGQTLPWSKHPLGRPPPTETGGIHLTGMRSCTGYFLPCATTTIHLKVEAKKRDIYCLQQGTSNIFRCSTRILIIWSEPCTVCVWWNQWPRLTRKQCCFDSPRVDNNITSSVLHVACFVHVGGSTM